MTEIHKMLKTSNDKKGHMLDNRQTVDNHQHLTNNVMLQTGRWTQRHRLRHHADKTQTRHQADGQLTDNQAYEQGKQRKYRKLT